MLHYARLYVLIITKEVRRYFTYRSNLYSGVLYAALSLAMRFALWQALYRTGNAPGATFGETMTFFIVTGSLFSLHHSTCCAELIGTDIRSGDIAQRLTKPYSYQFALITMIHAAWVQRLLTTGLPMLLIGFFALGIAFPASPSVLILFLTSLLLGTFIFLLIDLCISYSAFYLTDSWYISWLISALFELFGGMVLPMWFYPVWLLALSNALPFKYAAYEPMMIYLGRVQPTAAVGVIGAQCVWILALLLLERFLWSRALTKVVVQGG